MAPNVLPTLTTARLVLTPLTEADATELHPMFADPHAMRFMPTPPHATVDDTRRYLAADLAHDGARFWAVRLRDGDQGAGPAIGQVGFLGATRVPGMGYIIAPTHWGRGIATEACRAATAYGFETAGFDRIELWIDEHNVPSRRVAEKLGYRFRSRIPQKYPHEQTHHTMFIYGQTAASWRGTVETDRATRFFSVQPVLMTHDVSASVAFYRDRLGFEVAFLYGDPPTHAGVARGDWTGTGVNLQLTRVPGDRPIAPAGYLYVLVDTSIDRLYQTFRAAGVTIDNEPADHPWGMREFSVKDPSGHMLVFATHL